MSVTTPPTITALPTPPTTADPTSFDTRMDSLLTALVAHVTETNAASSNVYDNAVDAAASAASAAISAPAAAASAVAAAASAGASIWVSGTTYSIGDARYSPANRRVYRRLTAGAGTTDPSADGTNWAIVDVGLPVTVVAGTSQTATSGSHYILTNVALTTVTLPAAPASGDTVWVTVANGLYTNIIARNGLTIMGLAEDLLIDNANATVELRYANTSWRLV